MVTATGAVVVLYLLGRRIVWARDGEDESELGKSGRSGRRRIVRRPAQAPATWLETISTLSETLRFTYSETLGKWPIADLAFGINYLMRRQVCTFSSLTSFNFIIEQSSLDWLVG